MPRYARIHVAGGLFHVISRFHGKRFYLDVDGAREKYLELLGRASQTHDCRIIAYCLMSSHVHLVLQLGNDSLGSLTKKVHSPFGIWLNSRRKSLGTIMADRPKSVLVHSESYGVELIRYVHNNPVRAGLVERAVSSPWSSHRAYLGLEATPSWLVTEAMLGTEPAEQEAVRNDFAQYVDAGRDEKRRPEFSGEVTKALAKRMRRLLGSDVELSYPVLGPDEFVVSVLKNQAQTHQNKRRFKTGDTSVSRLTREIFGALGINPNWARKRMRTAEVARGRALVSWFWVEIMERPQVAVAQGLNVRPASVCGMLEKIRRNGLHEDEERLLDSVLEKITETDIGRCSEDSSSAEDHNPKVIVLKRKRKG